MIIEKLRQLASTLYNDGTEETVWNLDTKGKQEIISLFGDMRYTEDSDLDGTTLIFAGAIGDMRVDIEFENCTAENIIEFCGVFDTHYLDELSALWVKLYDSKGEWIKSATNSTEIQSIIQVLETHQENVTIISKLQQLADILWDGADIEPMHMDPKRLQVLFDVFKDLEWSFDYDANMTYANIVGKVNDIRVDVTFKATCRHETFDTTFVSEMLGIWIELYDAKGDIIYDACKSSELTLIIAALGESVHGPTTAYDYIRQLVHAPIGSMTVLTGHGATTLSESIVTSLRADEVPLQDKKVVQMYKKLLSHIHVKDSCTHDGTLVLFGEYAKESTTQQ